MHCPQCGSAAAEGARYCATCGAALVLPTLPPTSAAFPPPAPAAPASKDTGTAELLILVGAILAAVMGVGIALIFLSFGAVFGGFAGDGGFPAFILSIFAFVFAVLGVLFALGGLHARNLVRAGELEKGGLLAIVLGALLVVLANPIAGIVMLIGGVMAHGAK